MHDCPTRSARGSVRTRSARSPRACCRSAGGFQARSLKGCRACFGHRAPSHEAEQRNMARTASMGVPTVYPLMSVPVHAGRAAVTLVGSASTGPARAHAAFAGPRSVSRSSLATERSLPRVQGRDEVHVLAPYRMRVKRCDQAVDRVGALEPSFHDLLARRFGEPSPNRGVADSRRLRRTGMGSPRQPFRARPPRVAAAPAREDRSHHPERVTGAGLPRALYPRRRVAEAGHTSAVGGTREGSEPWAMRSCDILPPPRCSRVSSRRRLVYLPRMASGCNGCHRNRDRSPSRGRSTRPSIPRRCSGIGPRALRITGCRSLPA